MTAACTTTCRRRLPSPTRPPQLGRPTLRAESGRAWTTSASPPTTATRPLVPTIPERGPSAPPGLTPSRNQGTNACRSPRSGSSVGQAPATEAPGDGSGRADVDATRRERMTRGRRGRRQACRCAEPPRRRTRRWTGVVQPRSVPATGIARVRGHAQGTGDLRGAADADGRPGSDCGGWVCMERGPPLRRRETEGPVTDAWVPALWPPTSRCTQATEGGPWKAGLPSSPRHAPRRVCLCLGTMS